MYSSSVLLSTASLILGCASIFLAVIISLRQNKQTGELETLLRQSKRMLEDSEEQRRSAQEPRRATPDANTAPTEETGPQEDAEADLGVQDLHLQAAPPEEEAFVAELKRRKADLDYNSLQWVKKEKENGERRGNLGWFVSSPKSNERWFVHRGVALSVRPSVPVDLIEAWKKSVHRSPRSIRLDYQVSTSTNSSWFVEAYDGQTWRLSRGGRAKVGPTVTLVTD